MSMADVLPYYRIMDEKVAEALQAYYDRGTPPEPHLMALLQRTDGPAEPWPYERDKVMVHRWIQQWFPKSAWGSKRKVEKWCDSKEDT